MGNRKVRDKRKYLKKVHKTKIISDSSGKSITQTLNEEKPAGDGVKKFQKWRHPAFKSPEEVRGKMREL